MQDMEAVAKAQTKRNLTIHRGDEPARLDP